jgi:hypothetical protein
MLSRMVQSYADKMLAVLRPLYPDWDVWYVSRFPQRGYSWHAKPVGAPAATISAYSPAELETLISEQSQP